MLYSKMLNFFTYFVFTYKLKPSPEECQVFSQFLSLWTKTRFANNPQYVCYFAGPYFNSFIMCMLLIHNKPFSSKTCAQLASYVSQNKSQKARFTGH
jgi:hypothetical protein